APARPAAAPSAPTAPSTASPVAAAAPSSAAASGADIRPPPVRPSRLEQAEPKFPISKLVMFSKLPDGLNGWPPKLVRGPPRAVLIWLMMSPTPPELNEAAVVLDASVDA